MVEESNGVLHAWGGGARLGTTLVIPSLMAKMVLSLAGNTEGHRSLAVFHSDPAFTSFTKGLELQLQHQSFQ